MNSILHPQDVLQFWFERITPNQWWQKNADFDRGLAKRFGELLVRARQGELVSWRASASGRVAEIVVLDQFSRNIHRGTPQAYAGDSLALALAQAAVSLGFDQELPAKQRGFVYLPYAHSESLAVQNAGLLLVRNKATHKNYPSALRHQQVIERFGRFPHRNIILGRESTAEEREFLRDPRAHF